MRVVRSVSELIGRTPMMQLGALEEVGESRIYAKLEYLNPGMSVKDRTALGMIGAAEKDGSLKPGGVIVEATAGNAGLGLALVGVSRGYRVIIVMIEDYAPEKVTLARGLGAEIVMVEGEEGMAGAIQKAKELADSLPGAVMMKQFDNPANPQTHYETTAPEIWEQLGGRVDGLAIGAGTGGSFTGIARFLKERNPEVQCWVVEPPNSIFGGGSGLAPNRIEGIGNHWWPKVLDRSLIDGVFTIRDADSFEMVDRLGRLGLPVGATSGANVCGAKLLAKTLGEGKNVVTLLCDPSERYFSSYQYEGRWKGLPID